MAKNGKRVALVGAGPASLTVARDLAPLGYDITIFDGERRGGGMIRSQIPRFRLPEEVIDEEVGYIVGIGDIDTRYGQRIDSLKALLAEAYDAVFVGTRRAARPRPRRPGPQGGRGRHPHRHRLALQRLVRPYRRRSASASIVLGGGNTAMDCCRTARRLGGEDVKVVVRSGFEEMKASPWEKEDAMHEGIPILNYLVPKEFTHAGGRLTGVVFEKVAATLDDKGRRQLVPTGEPDVHIECDDVLVAIGQENAFPWIERDIGIEFDRWGMPKVDRDDHAVDAPEGVLRRRLGLRAEEHHLGRRPRP